jgi:deoxyribonucleoside regulator
LCGIAAADHLIPRLPERGNVGIAAGYTMAALASALPRAHRPGLTIVPIVGGWDTQHQFLDGNQLARRVAERLGAESRTLHAPAVLDTAEMREALLRDSTVAAIASQWSELALAIVGIGGSPDAQPGYRTVVDRLGDASRTDLRRVGAIGDVAGHFFRADGSFLRDWSDRTLAIPVDDLRRCQLVFAVAAGVGKAAAVLGGLRTGLVHVLVTDRATSEAILRLADRPR